MMTSAGGDQHIGGRYRHAGSPAAASQVAGLVPHLGRDREFWNQALELSQYFLLAVASGTIPEFKPDDRTPPGGACRQVCRHPGPTGSIAIGTKKVNPRGGIDENHISPGGAVAAVGRPSSCPGTNQPVSPVPPFGDDG